MPSGTTSRFYVVKASKSAQLVASCCIGQNNFSYRPSLYPSRPSFLTPADISLYLWRLVFQSIQTNDFSCSHTTNISTQCRLVLPRLRQLMLHRSCICFGMRLQSFIKDIGTQQNKKQDHHHGGGLSFCQMGPGGADQVKSETCISPFL